MSEETKIPEAATDSNDELLKKIQDLEQALDHMEQARKQKSMVSIIGLILVLLGLVLFFINLKDFASTKFSDDNFRNELMTIVRKDLKEIANTNPNVTLMQQDIKEKVLPYVSKQIFERFKQDIPEFQKVGENFTEELKSYLNKDVKDKLIKALAESLAEVEGVLKEKYPTMKADELQKILDEARQVFVIKITDVIEKKLDYISKDLGSLKNSIDRFKECEEYKQHDPANPDTVHAVKVEMVEAMLELVIYQLNSQKGQLTVEPLKGGVK